MLSIPRRTLLTTAAAGGAFAVASRGNAADVVAGDHNPVLAGLNPDSGAPPPTDAGDLPGFKYSFSEAHKRVSEGGWARQVTVKDFPIAQSIAGVNMSLTAGGIRELHWHLPAEWAYMISGKARITGYDLGGRSAVNDIAEGDLWFFPSGRPHSIQGLEPNGCEFLLAFDDGAFSEFDTFLITDWIAHTPPEILSKNFGVPAAAFAPVPKHELYIFQGKPPGALPPTPSPAQSNPPQFTYSLLNSAPDRETKGGSVRIADSRNFPMSTTIAAALVTVHPGGLRELHWHPNADEWQYFVKGSARMTVFGANGRARTMDFQAGDVGYVPRALGHYLENSGDSDMVFLELFRSDRFADLSLDQWITHTPKELVAEHLRMDMKTLDELRTAAAPVTPA